MTYYDEISEGYGELHNEEQLKKAKIIVEQVKPKPDETLLDVGCGDGSYLDLFECKVLGVDPSKKLLDKYKGKHKVLQAAAEDLPFKDSQFDIVVSITAVQNFHDVEAGLNEIRRVGKNRFAISVLKKSAKAEWIAHTIEKKFLVYDTVEEEKDLIFFCKKKL